VLLALAAVMMLLPAAALADGDPGSDVLLDQNLFSYWDANLSSAQQLQLGHLLDATARSGAPVRVAIIAHRDDLGTVGVLWQKPRAYAKYLGYELSLAYSGRLLIVMPNGYGVDWRANEAGAAKLQTALAGRRQSAGTSSALVAATVAAVDRIESAAGVSAPKLAHGSASAPPATNAPASVPAPVASSTKSAKPAHHSSSIGVIVAIALIVLLTAYIAVRSGRLNGLRLRMRPRPVMLVPVGLLAVVVVALVINQTGSSPTAAVGSTLATNPRLDPGTTLLAKPAPAFTLTDESGRRVSLSQYRGKVVILSFVDAECQTICPLTTQAMLDAKAALGRAGDKVQLLGVNANWHSTQVDDVLEYTEQHGLMGRWHFLTTSGSLSQLEQVWTAYHVNEKALEKAGSNDIEHIAGTYVIDPRGRMRYLFTTYPSYAAIGQMGQLLARDASRLLPSHPRVGSHESYAEIRGVPPTRKLTLPKLGGGSTPIGPGAARLYLFFATWDAQTTPIAAHLDALNAYAVQARRERLPALTAIDEGSVEPSSDALAAFVKGLRSPLSYPVADDASGRVADGYEVQGEPWFVLTNRAGQIVWYQEMYTAGWPSLAGLVQQVRAALRPGPSGTESASAAKLELRGSPAPLSALHAQSSQLLGGGQSALDARIAKLRGYPIVVNIWGSWCTPCQEEFGLFSQASAQFGKRVAFLGADTDDQAGNARAFLRTHPVSYPSYATTDTSIDKLLPTGLAATPTTVFIGTNGKVLSVHIGQYASQGTLDQEIEDAALGSH
jgi:cytochrome oxidase Cu insertion factor (SCO1/SenC/PrrC family)/thiol-disulfide isomerase/thioredoxin